MKRLVTIFLVTTLGLTSCQNSTNETDSNSVTEVVTFGEDLVFNEQGGKYPINTELTVESIGESDYIDMNTKKIFIHGLGQTPDNWEQVIENLSNEDEYVCLNLAEIVNGDEVTYNNLYKAFSDVCDQTEGRISLCGLSLGSVLALNYTIDHPDKVGSLVLIAPQYKMPKKLLKLQNIVFRFMPNSMFQKMGFGKQDFIQLCKTMMDLDFSESLSTVTCPTLIIYGENDLANKKTSVELAGILNNASLEVIKESGHEVNVETPEALAEVLNIFFNDLY